MLLQAFSRALLRFSCPVCSLVGFEVSSCPLTALNFQDVFRQGNVLTLVLFIFPVIRQVRAILWLNLVIHLHLWNP